MRSYAIIDIDEGLLEVVKTTASEAMDYAASLRRGDVWFDGPEEWLRESAALPMAANLGKKRSVEKMMGDPEHAMRRTTLPRITMEEVLAAYPKHRMDPSAVSDYQDPGLIAAHEVLAPLFPRDRYEGVDEIKQWGTPKGMVSALLTTNAKLSKEVGPGKPELPSYLKKQLKDTLSPKALGLQLAPHAMVFDAELEERAERALPYQLGTSGTLCFRKTAQCAASCLVFSGTNNCDTYNYVIKLAKARALLLEPVAFCRVLLDALGKLYRMRSRWPFCRLNTVSDIPWELFFPDIFRFYSDMWFYDYTKVPGRDPAAEGVDNYDLTFSYSGTNQEEMLFELTRMNRRVAVVFARKKFDMPPSWIGIPVVDGDLSDFRPLDPPNPGTGSRTPVIVGLSYKSPLGNPTAKEARNLRIFVVPAETMDGQVVIHQTPEQTMSSARTMHALSRPQERRLRHWGVTR